MTDQTPEANKVVDVTEALAAIEKSVAEKIEKGISSLEGKLPKEKAEEPEEFLPEESDDEPITKKDLAGIVSKVVQQVKKETDASFEVKSKKQMRDAQAFEEFPEVNQRSPHFSKKFFEEVDREIKSRVQRGRSAEDVDLIYDATAAVAARGSREGWYNPRARVERENVRRNSRDDSFDVQGTPPGSGSGPTEEQLKFASRVNLSKERLTQLFEKTRKK